MSNKFLLVSTMYVKRVVEPANQELASTATPEPIHNEINESTTNSIGDATPGPAVAK